MFANSAIVVFGALRVNLYCLFPSDSAAVHRDAAAELERMTKSKQTKRAHSDVNPNGPTSSGS